MVFPIIEQSALGGDFEGFAHGSEVSFFLERIEREGAGPRLHRHPYSETFVIRTGAARFTVADEQVIATAGQILVVPALVAHRFAVVGSDVYEAIHIHASERFITEWLE
ncbi:MAG TPA: cupin domain-containing protein [Microbacterium sp.]|nr:cupin domain-containing protein [Microbacterium sp.]